MKQHHLSLHNFHLEQSIVIEMRQHLQLLGPLLPETTPALIYALADLVAERGGDALEANMLSEHAIRELIADLRLVIFRRKTRPMFSDLDRQILTALGRRTSPVTLQYLCELLQLSRASVNTALYRLMHRDLVTRAMDGNKGVYALGEKAQEFHNPTPQESPPTFTIGAGALIQHPRVAHMKRTAAPYSRPKR